jgi:dihydrofolate reductase
LHPPLTQTYKLSLTQRAIVTEIARDFEGDAYAPELDSRWRVAAREEHETANGLRLAFVTYEKVAQG